MNPVPWSLDGMMIHEGDDYGISVVCRLSLL